MTIIRNGLSIFNTYRQNVVIYHICKTKIQSNMNQKEKQLSGNQESWIFSDTAIFDSSFIIKELLLWVLCSGIQRHLSKPQKRQSEWELEELNIFTATTALSDTHIVNEYIFTCNHLIMARGMIICLHNLVCVRTDYIQKISIGWLYFQKLNYIKLV